MSMLKSLAFFCVTLQLGLIMATNIYITPTHKLSVPAGMNNPLAEQSINNSRAGIEYVAASLSNNTLNKSASCAISAPGALDLLNLQNYLAKTMVCAIPLDAFDPLERLVFFTGGILMVICSVILLVISIVYGVTLGLPLIISSLCSMIDPVYGGVIGLVFGMFLAVCVFWGLTEFIPTSKVEA
jgi:hypothetical protein